MADGLRTPLPHLRIQLSLTGSRRVPASTRAREFASALRVATQNFPCVIRPEEPLVPGGVAVHCEVSFQDPGAALTHFPPGVSIELWEGSRIGYGMVLAVARVA